MFFGGLLGDWKVDNCKISKKGITTSKILTISYKVNLKVPFVGLVKKVI